MSIAPMKKLTLFSRGEDSGDIITALMKLRCVEMARADEASVGLPPCEYTGEIAEYQAKIDRIKAAVGALSKYSVRKFALIKPKLDCDRDAFVADGSYELAEQTVMLVEENIKNTESAREKLIACRERAQALEPWIQSPVPLDFDGTALTTYRRGSVPGMTDLAALEAALAENYSQMYEVSSDEDTVYIELYTLARETDGVDRVLAGYGFVPAGLPRERATAKALYRTALRETAETGKQIDELTEELKGLALRIDKLRILCDIESSRLEAIKKHEYLAKTDTVEYMTGWVPAEKQDKITAVLEKYNCAFDFEDPTEEDDPPVLLKNNKFASSFEWVIGLYSYPKYGSVDPTFIMAIFYCILFGLMFADAGYGLLFVLVAFVAAPLLKIRGSLRNAITMFGWCGVSCIVMGILFNGIFGDLIPKVAVNMFGAPADFSLWCWIDPVKEPLNFLIFSIAVGAVHLIAGMAVKFYALCREGHPLDAIFDVGLWWVLFAGIAMFVIIPDVGMWVLIGAVAAIVLTGGRKEKKWLMKPVKGLLSLYDLINFASDLLSYSRILALGLASAIIAQVVNYMGTMNGNTPAGWIMLIVVGIVGHVINIALNALGAFVHTSRLQYIEFFGKFYEDGGRKFLPVEPVGEYSYID